MVCIGLEDSSTESHLDEVCTHLFSFEMYVPYVPHVENIEDDLVAEANINYLKSDSEMTLRTQERNIEFNRYLKTQLKNIENFVKDNYKSNFLNTDDKTELELSLVVLD
jgi:hypothetical protein